MEECCLHKALIILALTKLNPKRETERKKTVIYAQPTLAPSRSGIEFCQTAILVSLRNNQGHQEGWGQTG